MTVKIASTNWFDLDADSEVSIVVPEVAVKPPKPPKPVVPAPALKTAEPDVPVPASVKVRKERRTPKPRPWRRVVSLVIFAAVVGAWFMLLRPTNLGGPASILVVRGVSMQPTMEYGDVIIAHRQSVYEVGDIVAFRVPEGEIGEGTVVIHRIIGGDATSGFETQGDGNNEPDEWRPIPTDILGSATWRIPLVGRLFSALRTVPGIAVLAGLLASLLVVLGVERPEQRRVKREKGKAPKKSPAIPRPPRQEDSLDDIIARALPLPPVQSAEDPTEVVGDYWGDDLGYLSEVLRDRNRSAALFDDNLEEVAEREA